MVFLESSQKEKLSKKTVQISYLQNIIGKEKFLYVTSKPFFILVQDQLMMLLFNN